MGKPDSGLFLDLGGVLLPAGAVADALDAYRRSQLLAEAHAPAGAPAFPSGQFVAAVRWLRAAERSAGARLAPVRLAQNRLVSCTELADVLGVAPVTVRAWAASARIPDAVKRAGTWWVPANSRIPADRRKREAS